MLTVRKLNGVYDAFKLVGGVKLYASSSSLSDLFITVGRWMQVYGKGGN